MDNRAGEMEVVITAVDQGGFSAAGRLLGMSPSAVSKLVTRLEDRLGTRLFVRSTRALQLTAEGEVYLAHARRILAEIAEAERAVAGGARLAPRGRLYVSASVAFGVSQIVPLVPQFMARYPQVELDLSLSDGIIDLVDARTDVAIRSGPLSDSSLKARRILDSPRMIVAAPDYLTRHGTPQIPADLDRHNCLRFNFRRSTDDWPFRDPVTGTLWSRPVVGNLLVNNGATMRRLCLDGVGLARLGRFHVQPDIDAGRLVVVLDDHNPGDIEPIHALYVGHEHLAARVRAFIDFLVETLPVLRPPPVLRP